MEVSHMSALDDLFAKEIDNNLVKLGQVMK